MIVCLIRGKRMKKRMKENGNELTPLKQNQPIHNKAAPRQANMMLEGGNSP